MEYDQNIYNEHKYFIDPNKEKLYCIKNENHDNLAKKILESTGLNKIYALYKDIMAAPFFLTCCGYVWVHEGEKNSINTIAVYCSKAINSEYIQYLKKIYCDSNDKVLDGYELKEFKTQMNQIIKQVNERKYVITNQENDEQGR